tara:strand:- start:94 stop:351 length:258 start_codon:yes stop_codon:yes gene_type:complete
LASLGFQAVLNLGETLLMQAHTSLKITMLFRLRFTKVVVARKDVCHAVLIVIRNPAGARALGAGAPDVRTLSADIPNDIDLDVAN